jgi:hypothetical protein
VGFLAIRGLLSIEVRTGARFGDPLIAGGKELELALSPFVIVVYAIGTHDGYHVAADHHDLVAYGTELALVVALVFVGAKLVGARLLR